MVMHILRVQYCKCIRKTVVCFYREYIYICYFHNGADVNKKKNKFWFNKTITNKNLLMDINKGSDGRTVRRDFH